LTSKILAGLGFSLEQKFAAGLIVLKIEFLVAQNHRSTFEFDCPICSILKSFHTFNVMIVVKLDFACLGVFGLTTRVALVCTY